MDFILGIIVGTLASMVIFAIARTIKWRYREKEASRFSEDGYITKADYKAKFKPYRYVITRADLSPRFPRGDTRNLERVKQIVDALVAEKVGG